ncbi:MAG: hypothetical protein WC379_12775 [Methanoregula sp.]|jgi:hypothetical protein
MQRTQKKIVGRIAERLFSFPVGYHLSSENFSRFCRREDLDDVWGESLDLSRDRPDLYGDSVIRNAFAEFLYHIFYRRPEKFPALFVRFLAGLSHEIARPLPLDDLKKDLRDLGYPAESLEKIFSVLSADEAGRRNRQNGLSVG